MLPHIHFDAATQTMEISISRLRLHNNHEISLVYDYIEDQIAVSGQSQWFFLVEVGDLYVNPAAWSYWASRGRLLNLGHSLGTVRYGASRSSHSRLESAGATEGFDPNLCADRAEAITRIAELRDFVGQRTEPERSYSFHDLFDRISFDHGETILHADLSDMILRHPIDVQDLFDHIETRILCMSPQFRWYFLVNYENVRILPTVESQFDQRGRSLNQRYSMGTARYGVPLPLKDQIYMRAESRKFDPNIFDTKPEALAHLRSMIQAT